MSISSDDSFDESDEEENKNNNLKAIKNNSQINDTKSINIVKTISLILVEIISNEEEKNDIIKSLIFFLIFLENYSIYNTSKPPNISIREYLNRIIRYSNIDISTLILCLIYIDRICDINNFQISIYNVHKLILGTLILAIKFNEDDYFSNDYYSKVGGMNNSEFNKLESSTLNYIEYNLWVDDKLYEKYLDYLEEYSKNKNFC